MSDKPDPQLQKEFQQMWKDFVAVVQAKGHEIVLMPVLRQDVAESVNKREQNLVAIIANTYLTGAVQFISQEQLKKNQAPAEPEDRIEQAVKDTIEELSKPE